MTIKEWVIFVNSWYDHLDFSKRIAIYCILFVVPSVIGFLMIPDASMMVKTISILWPLVFVGLRYYWYIIICAMKRERYMKENNV